MRRAFSKFSHATLRCPRCGNHLLFDNTCFRCTNRHTFDISGKGYVNLIPGQKPLEGYTADFFRSRRAVMDAGFYTHILQAVQAEASALQPRVIVDIGCGEGYYAKALQQHADVTVYALDASADAIREAASGGNSVRWIVGDLTNIPLADQSVDLILNIFSPANYAEFSRVLRPGGTLLKVIPGTSHLQELRAAFGASLRTGESYDNSRVKDWFAQHCKSVRTVEAVQTRSVTAAVRSDFLRMTPLAFGLTGVEAEAAAAGVSEITVAAELLIGQL